MVEQRKEFVFLTALVATGIAFTVRELFSGQEELTLLEGVLISGGGLPHHIDNTLPQGCQKRLISPKVKQELEKHESITPG